MQTPVGVRSSSVANLIGPDVSIATGLQAAVRFATPLRPAVRVCCSCITLLTTAHVPVPAQLDRAVCLAQSTITIRASCVALLIRAQVPVPARLDSAVCLAAPVRAPVDVGCRSSIAFFVGVDDRISTATQRAIRIAVVPVKDIAVIALLNQLFDSIATDFSGAKCIAPVIVSCVPIVTLLCELRHIYAANIVDDNLGPPGNVRVEADMDVNDIERCCQRIALHDSCERELRGGTSFLNSKFCLNFLP
eukprot:2347789-Rhodomonas_salina.2